MPNTNITGGTYGGSGVGYLEHEIDRWVWSRVRVSTGEPAGEPPPPPDHPVIIPMREVQKRVGFSRVHLWRLEKSGKFPKRIRLADHAIG